MAPKAGRGRGNRARGDKKKKEEKSMQSYPSILSQIHLVLDLLVS